MATTSLSVRRWTRRLWTRLSRPRLSVDAFMEHLSAAESADQAIRLFWQVRRRDREEAKRQTAKLSPHWSPALVGEVLSPSHERLTDLAGNPALVDESARLLLDWLGSFQRLPDPALPESSASSSARIRVLDGLPIAAGAALRRLVERGQVPLAHPTYQLAWERLEEDPSQWDIRLAVLAHPALDIARTKALLARDLPPQARLEIRQALLQRDRPERAAEHARTLMEESPQALARALPHLSDAHRRQVPRDLWADLLARSDEQDRLNLIRSLRGEQEESAEESELRVSLRSSDGTHRPSRASLLGRSR